MSQRLTITVDSDVYEGLKSTVGEAGIGGFLNDLARPYVVRPDLEAGYAAMAADEARESEAEAWSEELIGDTAGEATAWPMRSNRGEARCGWSRSARPWAVKSRRPGPP